MVLKSKMKVVAMVGFSLSFLSLAVHFFLARYSVWKIVGAPLDNPASWSTSYTSSNFGKAWSPVESLRGLCPNTAPRTPFSGPSETNNGFLFARIKGEFHNIQTSICDVVVVARLLNATLVLPELHEVSVAKGISSAFKEFGYIYDEYHFISALVNDVTIVKDLPKQFKMLKRERMMTFTFPSSKSSPKFYLEKVLPDLKAQGVIGIVVSGGGCLQSVLPEDLAEYQRLRCRVLFQALQFRRAVKELGLRMVQRLQALGQPYLAFHTGLELDALAYHGCAERFQDVHSELIQHKRAQMIKKGIVKGALHIDSELQRKEGHCPLMPEEVGILLHSLGYGPHTRIYISGAEVFGGQRVLIPLRAMFSNLEDRMTLTAEEERVSMFGQEDLLPEPPPARLIPNNEKARLESWAKGGPRPRPLPPPPSRQKFSHEMEGWWGWIGQSLNEPNPTLNDLRERGHKLLWAALDYIVCVESNAFFPGFDRDRNGLPNFASLVMGHRSYKSASQRTYRPDRKVIVKHLDEMDDLYRSNRSWMLSMREYLKSTAGEAGFVTSLHVSKPLSFLSHPHPECSCKALGKNGTLDKHMALKGSGNSSLFDDEDICPDWMHDGMPVNENESPQEDDYMESRPDLDFSSLALPMEKSGPVAQDKAEKEEAHMPDVEEESDSDD